MCKELKEIDWEPLQAYRNVDAAWCFIMDNLTTVFNRHAPFIEKRVKDRFSPWLSSEIGQQMNNRDKALRQARKRNNKTDWNFYKTLRNRCTNSIWEAKKKSNKNLLAKNSNNLSRFWKIIKEIIPIKCKNATSCPMLVKAESKKASDPVNTSNTLLEFLQKQSLNI